MAIMSISYCDNIEIEPIDEGWVDIERIYHFDWAQFDSDQMQQLRALFDQLPSSIKHDSDGCHWWFAEHTDVANGYLTAGMEPPGLHVFGTLLLGDWEAWDREFQRRSVGLPMRRL